MKLGALWLVLCVGGRGVLFGFVCWWDQINFKCVFLFWFTFLVICGLYTAYGEYFGEFHV